MTEILSKELSRRTFLKGGGALVVGFSSLGALAGKAQAADLLATTKRPTEAQIRTAMNGHLCRCGTYPRILTAIQKAAAVMAKGGK